MEITINYWAIIVGAVAAMVVGSIWYGPLFGKAWTRIIGATDMDLQKRKEMQKKAMPLYLVQFVLTVFQVLVLAHLIADTQIVSGLERALWIWAAFVVPTIAGTAMWNNNSAKTKWAQFLIQSGYQLVMFIIFGLLLMYWK
jgi:hypothetical protein